MQEPKILINVKDDLSKVSYDSFIDVYVERTDLENPYKLQDLVVIKATDSTGRQNLTDRVKVKMQKVDYTKVGKYPVTVSVIDDNGNYALATFLIHVVAEPQKSKFSFELNTRTLCQFGFWGITFLAIAFIFYFFFSMFY